MTISFKVLSLSINTLLHMSLPFLNSVADRFQLALLEVLPFSFLRHQPFENGFLLINF